MMMFNVLIYIRLHIKALDIFHVGLPPSVKDMIV